MEKNRFWGYHFTTVLCAAFLIAIYLWETIKTGDVYMGKYISGFFVSLLTGLVLAILLKRFRDRLLIQFLASVLILCASSLIWQILARLFWDVLWFCSFFKDICLALWPLFLIFIYKVYHITNNIEQWRRLALWQREIISGVFYFLITAAMLWILMDVLVSVQYLTWNVFESLYLLLVADVFYIREFPAIKCRTPRKTSRIIPFYTGPVAYKRYGADEKNGRRDQIAKADAGMHRKTVNLVLMLFMNLAGAVWLIISNDHLRQILYNLGFTFVAGHRQLQPADWIGYRSALLKALFAREIPLGETWFVPPFGTSEQPVYLVLHRTPLTVIWIREGGFLTVLILVLFVTMVYTIFCVYRKSGQMSLLYFYTGLAIALQGGVSLLSQILVVAFGMYFPLLGEGIASFALLFLWLFNCLTHCDTMRKPFPPAL